MKKIVFILAAIALLLPCNNVSATVAYALGLQIPEDWRGRPMMEAFKK